MNTVTKEAYEGDIVSRLRNWRGLHLAHSGTLFEEAVGEIERLRLELSVQKACTVAGREEIARLRLLVPTSAGTVFTPWSVAASTSHASYYSTPTVAPQSTLEQRVAALERWKDGFYDV